MSKRTFPEQHRIHLFNRELVREITDESKLVSDDNLNSGIQVLMLSLFRGALVAFADDDWISGFLRACRFVDVLCK